MSLNVHVYKIPIERLTKLYPLGCVFLPQKSVRKNIYFLRLISHLSIKAKLKDSHIKYL